MNNLSQALISKETNQRLNNHGLILTIKKSESDVDTEDYINEVGEYHTFFGLPPAAYPRENNESINDYMESVLEDFYGDLINRMPAGAIWFPIYDVGMNEHKYTIKQSKNTNWLTLCGLVVTDAVEIFNEFDIEKLNSEVEDIVVERIEKHLAVLAAKNNNEVYEITVKTDGNGTNDFLRTNKWCHNIGSGIDTDVNILISRVIADINKFGLNIEFSVHQDISDMEVHPASYINKKLSVLLGFKMAFGTLDFDKERRMLKTSIARSTLPMLNTIISATGESIQQGIYEHVANLKNIEEDNFEAKLEVLKQVSSIGFNHQYGNENLLGTYLGLFDYVDGIAIKSVAIEESPF